MTIYREATETSLAGGTRWRGSLQQRRVRSKEPLVGPATSFHFFDLLPWRFPLLSIDVGGSIFTSMEVSGSFHGSTWKCPLSVKLEASIASINCSFHEYLPWKLP